MTKRKELQVEVIYLDEKSDWYFVTPDGIGVWWYETLEEAQGEHGDTGPVRQVYLED